MWQQKNTTYKICIPTIEKPLASMNSTETEAYFKWYMEKIPERIDYLVSVISSDLNISKNEICLSSESLLIVWKWFLSVAKTEKDESIGVKLDLQTEYIVRDIGMFLGELFSTSHNSIYWGYYENPRSDVFVNTPLLLGFIDRSGATPFEAVFEPIHMVRVQACKIITNRQSEEDLKNLYDKWRQKVENR